MERVKLAILGAVVAYTILILLGLHLPYWDWMREDSNTARAVCGDILFTMEVDKNRIYLGESIKFNLTIRNNGDENVTIRARAPVFDIYLYDPSGNLVAKYTDGRLFIALIVEIDLKPGDSYSRIMEWNLYRYNEESGEFDPIDPGLYRVSGVCLISSKPIIETDTITIEVLKA